MHEIFTNRYCDLELHVKCDNPREFINIINAFKEQSNLDPSIVKSYSGDINDYCRAFTRGSGDIKYVSLAQVIGEYACDHNNNAFLDIINETGFNETIHYAVDNGAFEQVEYILYINSSYANAPGPQGKTPLYHAITNVNVTMVELLLDRGADPALLYGNDVLSNYLDHALWVYDHYYGSDEYNSDKITIIRRIMSYGTEPTRPLTPEQRAIYDKYNNKYILDKQEQEEWEALALEHEEEERRLREEEEIQKDFEYWEAMEEANRPKTRGEQLVEEEEMRIRDREQRRWRLERRW